MINEAQLTAAGIDPALWLANLIEVADWFELNTPRRVAHFLAQTSHESGGYRRLEENLSYSAERLVEVWPNRFTPALAARCAHRPELIANTVYSSRMGNGEADSGDGWKYRGRGILQITGRSSYGACGEYFSLDLLNDPDRLAEDRQMAGLSAGWFWRTNGCNDLADDDDIEALTKRINGGLTGLDQRRALYERIPQ